MATLTPIPQSSIGAGGAAFVAASGGGDKVDNSSGQIELWVYNQSASPITVTVAEGRTCDFGHAHQNDAVVINAGIMMVFRTYRAERWNDSLGMLSWTYSAVTNVLVAAILKEERFRG